LPGVDVKTQWGSSGQMDVFRDGQKVFSYQESGRMPSVTELVTRITG